MQNKGIIKTFAIIFGLICLYYLSFTWVHNRVVNDANEAANGDAVVAEKYLDSVANKPVANYLFQDFTGAEVEDRALNLGLDLKGGINATLELQVRSILIGLSNDSNNAVFNKALNSATAMQLNSDQDYLTLFFEAFENESKGSVKLSDPSIFGNQIFKDKINFKLTDAEVKPILQEEIKSSISTAFTVLRNRIDRFGVASPNIQQVGQSGRILVELPGAKDIDRVKKLLESTAELQFWECYENTDTFQFFFAANTRLAELLKPLKDTVAEVAVDSTNLQEAEIEALLAEDKDSVDSAVANPLHTIFRVNVPENANQRSSAVGSAQTKDTAQINAYLRMPEIRRLLPSEMVYTKFLWDAQADKDSEIISLYAIKSNSRDIAPIEGDVVSDAMQQFAQNGSSAEVSMTMNSKGTKLWAKMTEENVGKFVAVVLDNLVYSAPVVNGTIPNGRTSIEGNFSVAEAQDLANALKSGRLPAAAQIIESSVVGASLGQEAIQSSTIAFILALTLVLLWMLFYYGKAGIYANIALLLNILFIFGVLSAFGAVLTLSGVAGIIITIGMSVDANVIIYERIKEALHKGKNLKDAIAEGFSFKGALSAIIDANITTFLTGIILYIFGSGPIKGFATTLMIGIATSLISAVFITRMLVEWSANRDRKMTFNTAITKGWFQNIRIDFLVKRKIAYIISGLIIAAGIFSLATNSLNYGVDFEGGRSYTVRFDKDINPTEVSNTLKDAFGDSPEVKTYGPANQLKITTNYKVDESSLEVSDEIQQLMFTSLQSYLPDGITLEDFKISANADDHETKIGIMGLWEVGPTIADDIKQAAIWAIFGSLLVVFLYILLRFRKWQYSLGAVLAVFHDVLIVLAVFSIFYKVMPFDMEIGQSFIAALLTVVGYSLNDTVVIFDRIREFAARHDTWPFSRVVNAGLSSTLGRTINTSLTTLIVLLSIFIFGGDSIKGFMFAMIIGVVVGTYSSLFIASPIMYDTTKKLEKKN